MTNIKGVAKRANVSIMTVSRVINYPEQVTQKTKEKVRQAIDELNYIPNQLAQGLARSKSGSIGVLFSNLFNTVYSSIVAGIEQTAKEKDYNVIISIANDYNETVRGLETLISMMVDGLIILPIEPVGMDNADTSSKALEYMWKFYDDLKQTLTKRKIPCVIIDINLGEMDNVAYVYHDYVKAAKLGLDYLIDKGFTSIHHINSSIKKGLWVDRLQVYTQTMQQRNLPQSVDFCENNAESAFKVVTKLLKSGVKPQVFYCANDVIAVGAIQAITSYGYKVPGDISVMGNDGIYIGDLLVPKLTSVSINSYELGKEGMKLCSQLIEGVLTSKSEYIEPSLAIRGSVKIQDKK